MAVVRVTAMTVALSIVQAGIASPVRAVGSTAPPAESCRSATSAAAKTAADHIMQGRLTLGTHPEVTLPADPTWREAPFGGDTNWLFNYHALRWVLPLLQTGAETGQVSYIQRAQFLLRDWLGSNPRRGARPMTWDRHATAWRASVLACSVSVLGAPAWLVSGLRSHGAALADPAFYEKHGNHALNQAIGLLDIGCRVNLNAWKSLAATRLASLVVESVDAEGVTNEQAVGYQLYNYNNYERARRHLTNCRQPVPTAFARVQRMPEFLAYATAPDGRYEQLGDTDQDQARAIPGTLAEFAATGGATGPRPPTTIKRYAAGYLFARSGWGSARPFDRETFLSIRFGPGRIAHGHADGGSLTLVANGLRLLIDPGKFTYTRGPWRTWFVGRTAHNVVSVDGLTYQATRATTLTTRTTAAFLLARVANSGYTGVKATRSILWSRVADYLVVDDALSGSTVRTFRQAWHLAKDSSPFVAGDRLDTRQTGSNLAIVQLVGHPTNRIVSGSTRPIQGWLSIRYGTRSAAPVLESTLRGRSARYLTLLVPYSGARPAISGRVVRLASDGYVVDVSIGSRLERLTVSRTTTSVVVIRP